MTRTSWVTILALTVLGAAGSYGGIQLLTRFGVGTPPTSWLTHAFMAIVTVWILVRGLGVKRLLAGKKTSMTVLQAARVVAAAKATTVVDSLLTGYFAALLRYVIPLPPAPVRVNLLISGIAGVIMGIVMIVIAFIVEHWCEIDVDDDDHKKTPRPA